MTRLGRHFSSFVPLSQKLRRTGRADFATRRNPGLKPWAVLYSRFAAKADSPKTEPTFRLRWLQRYSFFRVSYPAEHSPAVYARALTRFHRERK
jgi:hypothetical protein